RGTRGLGPIAADLPAPLPLSRRRPGGRRAPARDRDPGRRAATGRAGAAARGAGGAAQPRLVGPGGRRPAAERGHRQRSLHRPALPRRPGGSRPVRGRGRRVRAARALRRSRRIRGGPR
ncbi:hypothetical protein GMDG_09026, partial [Pseudogymnoascus destructans 20631-21]